MNKVEYVEEKEPLKEQKAIEFDTSYLAWILYRIFYGNDKTVKNNKGRSYVEIDFGNKTINMSGDTDYNFGPGWSHSIRKKYEDYLGQVPPKYVELYNTQLRRCVKLYKSILNISFMPQTGNLQIAKKGIGNDRLDTYIWALNSYYIGETSLLFNNSTFNNTSYLKEYLDLFRTEQKEESIYNYCYKIYGIESHELVDELIEYGKEAIDSPEKVIAYMYRAYRFWRQKLIHIKKMMECNKNILTDEEKMMLVPLVEEAEKELNKWFES